MAVAIINWDEQSGEVNLDALRAVMRNRKSLKVMDARACNAFMAAKNVAGFLNVDPSRACVAVAVEGDTVGEGWQENFHPLWLLGQLPNMVASHISMELGWTGASQTCGTRHWAGWQALLTAFDWLERGIIDGGVVALAERTYPQALALALAKKNRGTRVLLKDYSWRETSRSPDLRVDQVGLVEGMRTILNRMESVPAGGASFLMADEAGRGLELCVEILP